MKEPKKEPVPRFAESDPALAATDPGDPPFVAPQPDAVNRTPHAPLSDAGARDFSHLDPETAARAARIVDAYQKSRARSPEEFEANFRKPAHRDSLDVFVDALHHAKPAVQKPSPVTERESPPPRENATPPDSPEAIRSSRNPVARDLAARSASSQAAASPDPSLGEPSLPAPSLEDPSAHDPIAEGEGDRITWPSLRRQRKRTRMLVVTGIGTAVVVALASGWFLFRFVGAPAATAPTATGVATTEPVATAPALTAPAAAVMTTSTAKPAAPATASAPAAPQTAASPSPTHTAPASTSRTRTPKPARPEPPGSELLQ